MANKPSFQTYKGIAVYPWINKADTEYNSDGVYKTGLRVPADQCAELMKKVQQVAMDEFGAKKADRAKMPWKIDEETGEVIINTKSKFQPKVYDADGQYIPADRLPQIWGGAIIRCGGVINTYDQAGNTGVSLQLSKIQVIELAERSGGDDEGFDAVEGGGFTMSKDESDNDGTKEEGFSADF